MTLYIKETISPVASLDICDSADALRYKVALDHHLGQVNRLSIRNKNGLEVATMERRNKKLQALRYEFSAGGTVTEFIARNALTLAFVAPALNWVAKNALPRLNCTIKQDNITVATIQRERLPSGSHFVLDVRYPPDELAAVGALLFLVCLMYLHNQSAMADVAGSILTTLT